MKQCKFHCVLLAVMLGLSLCACGGEAPPGNGGQADSKSGPVEQTQQSGDAEQSAGPEQPAGEELPFDITGDFFDMYQSSTTAPAQMRVEASGGGYVVVCGQSVSEVITAEVDQVTGDVRLSGPMAKVNGQKPGEGSNWHLNASFNNWNSAPEVHMTIMDVTTNNQDSRMDGQFQKLAIRIGTYSYWSAEWQSDLSDYDWDNAVLAQGAEVEYKEGRFRFTLAERYASDWLEPSNVSPHRCEFTNFIVTSSAGEKLEADLYLNYDFYFSTADVTVYNADRTDRLLSFTAYTQPDESFRMEEYLGTYETQPGEEPHTVVVEADRLTVDGRYVLEYTREDFVTRWRPLYVRDNQDSAYRVRTTFSYSGDGDISVSSDDGIIRVYALRK